MYNDQPVKLCIIDDIKSVVDGLAAMNWAEHGIEVAGSASNGEDGLQLAAERKPDIVITDIRMPRMDGLAMLSGIMERIPGCKVVLISGYADFEYAQKAVQLGAFDFVVKPFTAPDIRQAVLRAKDEVLAERKERLNRQTMESRLRESLPLLRQEYVAMLVSHRTPWEKTAGRWSFLNIGLKPRGFTVMLIDIDRYQEQLASLPVQEIELVRFSLQNIIEETLSAHAPCIVMRARHRRFLVVMNDPSGVDTTRLAESCCRNIETYSKYTVSIGVGGRVEETSELPDSYRQALHALAYHLYTEGNAAILYSDLPQAGTQLPLALEHKDELLLALRSGNAARAAGLLDDITASLHKEAKNSHPDYLLSLYDELAASAIRILYELVPYADIQPLVQRFHSTRGVPGVPLSALEYQLRVLCQDGAGLVRSNSQSEGQRIVYEAMDYIKGRLERELTVADIAAHVHLSVSYFSSLFKKITGMTATQYLTGERIQKAKQLLVEGVPVQEVAACVGYEERRYFSDMFKKITGQTPSEFRAGYHPDIR